MGEDIIKEVLRLAVGAGLPLTVTLVLLVVAAVLMVVGRKLGGITFKPYTPEVPPPAKWDSNVTPPDPDHPGGGMEGG